MTSTFTQTVTRANLKVEATYTVGDTSTFQPRLTFNIPYVDVDGNDKHDLSGARFDVVIEPATDANCARREVLSYRLNSSGHIVHPNRRLINQHSESTTPCVYSVTFPFANTSAHHNRLAKSPTLASDYNSMSAAANDAQATYAVVDPFDATLSMSTTNVPDNAAFTVSLDRQSGLLCSPRVERRLTVSSGAASATVPLIDAPTGSTQASDSCVYELTWQPELVTDDVTYALDPSVTPTATVDVDSAEATAAYGRLLTLFAPLLTLNLPDIDIDGTAGPDFVGTEFLVTFTRSADTNCSPSRTGEVYRMDDAGAIAPVTPFKLIDEHRDSSAPCTYAVEFAATNSGTSAGSLAKHDDVATDDGDVSASGNDAQATYRTTEVPFTATLTLTGTNVPDGTVFAVRVDPPTGTSCTERADHELTVANGTATAHIQLADLPAGYTAATDACVYAVGWPNGEQSANLLYPRDPNVAPVTAVSEANPEATATYWNAASDFSPVIAIAVPQYARDGAPVGESAPNFFADATFNVSFAPKAGVGPATGCSPNTDVTYVTQANGTVVPTSFTLDGGSPTRLAAGELPSLVATPTGEAMGCTYVATFPTSVPGVSSTGAAWTLRNTGVATAELSTTDVAAGSTAAERRFDADAISFVPTVAVTVPPIAGTTLGENLFGGATIDVTLARAAVPAQHDECSLATTLTVPFTIDTDGTATASTTPPNALPASLVDRPRGETTRCAYAVTFQPTNQTPGAELTWTLTSGSATAMLSGGSAQSVSARGAYDTSEAVTYAPDVTITVPTYSGDDDPSTQLDESTQGAFVGEQVSVEFASVSAGCHGTTMTFAVQPDGSVAPDGPVDTLVAYPAGSTVLCSYDVTFSPTEMAGVRLALEGGASNVVTGLTQVIGAAYENTVTNFEPSVAVSVPFVDADGDGANDLLDEEVTFGYAPVAMPEQDGACTSSETETWTVRATGPTVGAADAGVAERTSATASLVDRPARLDHRCRYAVRVSETAALTAATLTPSVVGGEIGALTAEVAVTYRVQPPEEPDPAEPSVPPEEPDPAEPSDLPEEPGPVEPPVPPEEPGPVEPPVPVEEPDPVEPPVVAEPPTVIQLPRGGSQQPTTSRQTGGVPSGGAARRTASGGGGSRSGGGGSTGGGSGGSTGPWLIASSSRVPVSVSLAMPAEASFPVGAAVEVWLSVPGTCGDDTTAFSGLAAQVGLVYALSASPGATIDVLAADALRLAGYAQRGDQTRGCELRVTLVSAPLGCTFDDASTDDADRSYVELSGGESITTYAATPRLTCA